jgi:hypothetical protein
MRIWLKQAKGMFDPGDERGQAVVVVAFAIVGLLLFAGLALDAATIYSGQTRLRRGIDAAALAAVVELPDTSAARERTKQFMLANGIDTDDTEQVTSFQTARVPASGLMQWAITATYRVPLNFLPIINFDFVDVTEHAVAEYRSMVEVYASQTGGRGFVGPITLFNFGKWSNPRFGDAFTPQCYTCVVDCDQFGAGKDMCPAGENPDHSELFNESGTGYPFNIRIPEGYSSDEVQIEILDPDGYNAPPVDSTEIKHTDGVSVTHTELIDPVDCVEDEIEEGDQNERMDPCLIYTGDAANRYWFMRLDEIRSFGGQPSTYSDLYATETVYRLYYLKQLPDHSIIKVQLRTYVGGAADASTDMQWFSPPGWTLDIDCDDGCDIPSIVENRDGSRSLLLEVDGASGYSKNAFDLWAGPPPGEGIPANVNERNLYLLENRYAHAPDGIIIYGQGYLPLSVNGPPSIDGSRTISMTYLFIPSEAIGAQLNLFHFDSDSGGGQQTVDYYLEGVGGWHQQGSLSLDGTHSTTQNYVYQPPGARDHDGLLIPDEFYGAYLHGNFTPAYMDASTWRLEYEGMVGEVFVRLIE